MSHDPSDSTILTPVSDMGLLGQTQILVLRAIQDSVNRIEKNSKEVAKEVSDVKERLIRIEAEDTKTELRIISARLTPLENDLQQRRGVSGFFGWLGQNWPMVVSLVGVAYVLLKGHI